MFSKMCSILFSFQLTDFCFLNVSPEIKSVSFQKEINKEQNFQKETERDKGSSCCRKAPVAPSQEALSTHLALVPDAFISLRINVVRCQGEADQSPFQPLGFNLFQCLLSYKVRWLRESKIMMMNECSNAVTRSERQAFKFVFAIFLPITHSIKIQIGSSVQTNISQSSNDNIGHLFLNRLDLRVLTCDNNSTRTTQAENIRYYIVTVDYESDPCI